VEESDNSKKGEKVTRMRGSNEFKVNLPTFSVKVSHPLYLALHQEYGLPPHNRKRKSNDNELDGKSDDNELDDS